MQIASISESFAPLLCLLTCGGFLAVVFHYASAFNRDVNAHRHILSQLSTPRFDLIQADKEFKWLHWLYSQTRNPKLAPPSRIEAMHEFDGLYFQRSDYTFVVRSREYAPFIGLLLTAFVAGFFYLFELENLDNASQGEMVRRVLPLLIGVAVGALLTLACSGIAQYINGTANTYRQDALEWFDYASRHARDALAEDAQNQIAAQITATNWNIADEISRFLAQALAKTEQVQCENEHLRQSATATMQAAESASASAARATTALEREIAKVCQNLSINISNLIDALSENAGRLTKFSDTHRDELHAISESTVELRKEWLTLQPEIRTIARGGASLAEATRTFSDAFGPAAEAIQSASQQYAHLTSVLGASAIAVNGATDRLQSAFVSHTAALQALNGSMQDSFIPSCCTLVASVEQLEHNTQHLNQHTQQMAISFDAASAGLKRFENVSNSFELAVDGQFVPAVTSLAELPNIIQSFRQSTDDAGRTLRDAGSAVQQAVRTTKTILAQRTHRSKVFRV